MAVNKIGDKGAEALATALGTNKSLITLDLRGEHPGGHGHGDASYRGAGLHARTRLHVALASPITTLAHDPGSTTLLITRSLTHLTAPSVSPATPLTALTAASLARYVVHFLSVVRQRHWPRAGIEHQESC